MLSIASDNINVVWIHCYRRIYCFQQHKAFMNNIIYIYFLLFEYYLYILMVLLKIKYIDLALNDRFTH